MIALVFRPEARPENEIGELPVPPVVPMEGVDILSSLPERVAPAASSTASVADTDLTVLPSRSVSSILTRSPGPGVEKRSAWPPSRSWSLIRPAAAICASTSGEGPPRAASTVGELSAASAATKSAT